MRKGGLVAFAVAVVLAVSASSADTLDVYFINVGHGDAILIDYNGRECLIDFGGPTKDCSELNRVSDKCNGTCLSCHNDLLLRLIDGDLELAILSHNHWDHYGGFVKLLALLTATEKHLEELWQGPDRSADCEGTNWEMFQDAVSGAGLAQPFDDALAGPPQLHPDVTWTFLAPQQLSESKKNDNENSVVLLLTYGSVGFLFTGDLEELATDVVAEWQLPEILILKAPHHGRSNSATQALAESLEPDLIVVTTGHCVPQTGGTLTQLGIPFLSTSTSGTIRLSTDGESVWVTTDTLSGQVVDCTD